MKFRVSFTAALLAAGLPLMSLQAAPLQAVPAVQAGNATQATMLAAGWAMAAGDAADPLTTLSYLTGAFKEAVDQRVDQRLNEAGLSSGSGAVPAASALSWAEKAPSL